MTEDSAFSKSNIKKYYEDIQHKLEEKSKKKEKFEMLVRHHDPSKPFNRTLAQKSLLWVTQTLFIIELYYFVSVAGDNGFLKFDKYSISPLLLLIPSLLLLGNIYLVIITSKIFYRTSVIIGAFLGEFLVEYINFNNYQPSLLILVPLIALLCSLKRYEGGEYYKGEFFLKQIGSLLLISIIGAIIITLLFRFDIGVNFPLEISEGKSLSEQNARIYIGLYWFFSFLILILPIWLTFWTIDKILAPSFPLTDEEKQIIEKQGEITEEERAFNSWFPQPGEFYNELLTHHPIDQDDHTIVIKIGKTRVYLCTRCTGMVFGIINAILISQILFEDLGLSFSSKYALICIIIFPWIALIDWGLQAVQIRKATTTSRLITGFLVGISAHLISFTGDYFIIVLVIILIDFIIFSILAKIKEQKLQKNNTHDAFIEKFG